jgi:hypothetical protein
LSTISVPGKSRASSSASGRCHQGVYTSKCRPAPARCR